MAEKLGNRRTTGTEQFYTPRELATSLVQAALPHIPKPWVSTFLEPAAGNGSFVEALQKAGAQRIIALDRYPAAEHIREANFLETELAEQHLITVTNPPFGRNNALSIPFFNHAARFSDTICFLVPRSWRKWSVTNRLDRDFHLSYDQDVYVSYEDAGGTPIRAQNGLRTCFQIWQRQAQPREKIEVPDNGLITKSSPEDADIAIRVFGYGCGTVVGDFPRRPNTTLMFLRTSKRAREVLPLLEYSKFSENTAYTQALAFTEINYLLNEAIYGNPFHREKAET
ncbi:MAG: hypothetical protein VW959_05830 [Aquiluna sp.]